METWNDHLAFCSYQPETLRSGGLGVGSCQEIAPLEWFLERGVVNRVEPGQVIEALGIRVPNSIVWDKGALLEHAV